MDMPSLEKYVPPAISCLISFVAFSGQWLFIKIEPGALSKGETYTFNSLVACLLFCYWRSCYIDPGRIPKDWHEAVNSGSNGEERCMNTRRQRWCRKCEAFKPPRAHHCKTCKRCIAKMDHHCVWTANCVSHVTLPHFLRFLTFNVSSMSCMEYFLYLRCAVLWQKRHLPSYLGPSMFQFVHLFILVAINSFMLFMIGILYARVIWSILFNVTTIESWEIERHETLLRRSRALGGYLIGPDGSKIHLKRQEFPWDIGIWNNLCQAFNSRKPLTWLWPFCRTPDILTGVSFEHNGIEDESKPWPPPDPDRTYRTPKKADNGNGFTQAMDVESFRSRQLADQARYTDIDGEYVVRRRPFHERLENMVSVENEVQRKESISDVDEEDSAPESTYPSGGHTVGSESAGEEGWRNKEGERLQDFGVDEVAEFYDEDEIPLSVLIQSRKATQ